MQPEQQWDDVHNRITTHSAEVGRVLSYADGSGPLRVLDLACGTGRHVIEFAQLGHRCLGIDQLAWKIRQGTHDAASLGLDVRFVQADLRAFAVSARFDLVVCLYAMSTMRADADFLAAMQTARGALAPAGRFVFNVINAAATMPAQAPVSRALGDGHLRQFDAAEVAGLVTRAEMRAHYISYSDVDEIARFDMWVCAEPVCGKQQEAFSHSRAGHG